MKLTLFCCKSLEYDRTPYDSTNYTSSFHLRITLLQLENNSIKYTKKLI